MLWKTQLDLLKECGKVLNDVDSKIFPIGRHTQGKTIKIWTLKQMFKRLPLAPTNVTSGNTSEDLLNEIFEVM